MLRRRRLRPISARAHAVQLNPSAVLAIAAIALACLLVWGCGSSKKTSTSASTAAKPALTKAQFLARGNAICARRNHQLRATEKALEKVVGKHEPTRAQITAYVKGVLAPLLQSEIDSLKALGAPQGEEAAVKTIIVAAQSDLARVKNDPALVLTGKPFSSFVQLARPYGLTACAKGASR